MTSAVGSSTPPTQTTPTSSTPPSSSSTTPSKSSNHGGSSSGSPCSKGGSPPSDFHGHRRGNPDYDRDGKISDAEATVYRANMRSADHRYSTDSRERIAHEKEVAKNYRAEVSAHTSHVHDANSNKLHKMFGFSFSPPPPPKPEKPF